MSCNWYAILWYEINRAPWLSFPATVCKYRFVSMSFLINNLYEVALHKTEQITYKSEILRFLSYFGKAMSPEALKNDR
jgi:hypothetical protein